jgi:hypothetical protein
MSPAIKCIICLALANFLVESWQDIANYEHALETTWNQAWAIFIYHFIWVDE